MKINDAINALKNGNKESRRLAMLAIEEYANGKWPTSDLANLVSQNGLSSVIDYIEFHGTSYSKETLITLINALYRAIEDTAKELVGPTLIRRVEANLQSQMNSLKCD